jgi:hypothetical protein
MDHNHWNFDGGKRTSATYPHHKARNSGICRRLRQHRERERGVGGIGSGSQAAILEIVIGRRLAGCRSIYRELFVERNIKSRIA